MCTTDHRGAQSNRRPPPPTTEGKGGLKGLGKVGPSDLMKERRRRENRGRECPSNRCTQAESEEEKESEKPGPWRK